MNKCMIIKSKIINIYGKKIFLRDMLCPNLICKSQRS